MNASWWIAAPSLVAAWFVESAHGQVVSPPGWEQVWGQSEVPVFLPGRLQQIHPDLRGRALTLTRLSFRPNEFQVPGGEPPLAVDVEADFGQGDFTRWTNVFANNYVGAPARVVGRRSVAIPAVSSARSGRPDPFILTLPLDRPWLYSGERDFIWEMRVFAVEPGNASTLADEAASWPEWRMLRYGLSCDNRRTWLEGQIRLNDNPRSWSWYLSARYVGERQPTVLLLAQRHVDFGSPILCAPVHVDGIVSSLYLPESGVSNVTPFDSTLIGIEWFMQAYAYNPGRTLPLLPVEVTNGLAGYFPGALPPVPSGGWLESSNPMGAFGNQLRNRMLVMELR
jgi:hypothetical protein